MADKGPSVIPSTGSNSATVIGPPLRPPKRRKIPLACNACRDRKSRCDGFRPLCSTCQKRKTATACVYEESTLKTQQNIASLEDRVRELEGSNANASRPASALGHQKSPALFNNISLRQDDASSHDVSALAQGPHHLTRSSDARHMLTPSSIISDPLNAGPSTEEDSEHLFGKSSTTSFIRSLKQTILQSDGVEATRASQNGMSENNNNAGASGSGAGLVHGADTSAFTLPPRRQADRYTKCFWQYVHLVFPILHKPSFVTSYQSIWMSEEERSGDDHSAASENPIFLSTLSIVFAIGCQFTDTIDPGHKTILAEQFYHQARKLFAIDELDSVSLPAVQLLLLTGVYLHTTKYTNRCWNVVGLAIRNAQSLGLHEEEKRHPQSQIERETRRRVWYNCVVLDRLVAMIFGRPHMISSSSNVLLPLLIDDEYLLPDGEGQQPAYTISYMGLFISSIKLFDIISDVLSLCYYQKETSLQSRQSGIKWWHSHPLDDVLKINSALDGFQDALPKHLKIQQNIADNWTQNMDNIQWVQTKILQCRFLYVRALLLRPLLLSAAQHRKDASLNMEDSTDIQLGERVALQVCLSCVETVHELVAAIYNSLHVNYQSPGWVTHYAFSCAMVLAAARMCSFSELQCSSASLQQSWSRCIVIFVHYKGQIPSAAYAVQFLEALQQRVALNPSSDGGAESNNFNPPNTEGANGRPPQDINADWSNTLLDDFAEFDVLNMNSLHDSHVAEQLIDFNWMGQAQQSQLFNGSY